MSLVGALDPAVLAAGALDPRHGQHAFERARASDKAVDDTRLRIFFVLALFGLGFVTLALGATRAALFSPWGHGSDLVTPAPNARAELTDRNGAILAIDEPRYGLYVDPHEMVHKADVRAALLAAMPAHLARAKLDRDPGRRQAPVRGRRAVARPAASSCTIWRCPASRFEEESGRAYPLDALAAHVIGFSSRGRDWLGRRREGVRCAAAGARRQAAGALHRPARAGRAGERARPDLADAGRRRRRRHRGRRAHRRDPRDGELSRTSTPTTPASPTPRPWSTTSPPRSTSRAR